MLVCYSIFSLLCGFTKVNFKTKHDWLGWKDDKLLFKSDNQEILVNSDLTILSLGGASWPQLGSDGSWVNILKKYNIEVSKLQPSNCGFFVNWSKIFADRFAGKPLKSIKIKYKEKIIKGEFVITKEKNQRNYKSTKSFYYR